MANENTPSSRAEYISPRQLARRWQCSRTTVDRIVRQADLSRVRLGHGPNGTLRYLRAEIEEFEQQRLSGPV